MKNNRDKDMVAGARKLYFFLHNAALHELVEKVWGKEHPSFFNLKKILESEMYADWNIDKFFSLIQKHEQETLLRYIMEK